MSVIAETLPKTENHGTLDPLKIGFLSEKNPLDKAHWSGTIHYLHRSLRKYTGNVEIIGERIPLHLRLLWHAVKIARGLFGERLGINESVIRSLAYIGFYRRAIRRSGCEVIFAPIASTEIAFLQTDLPIIYLSDGTFGAHENYFYKSCEITRLTRWEGNLLQKRVIRRADALIYSSQWAANSAINLYGADPSKVHVIPFGANIDEDEVPPRENLRGGSTDGKCRLLFVGRKWLPKGGDIAYDAFLALRSGGIDAELTVIGCEPTPKREHPNLRVIPFLNKKDPAHKALLDRFYLEADFFLLPTRKECFGIVFCEAAAFGLPAVTTHTGGVSDVVLDQVTGIVLPLKAQGESYADAIFDLWNNPVEYQAMRTKSRERYEQALNWENWGKAVRTIMEDLLMAREKKRTRSVP
jgi:glycosyltransferase involved in cell wall biosynthesis